MLPFATLRAVERTPDGPLNAVEVLVDGEAVAQLAAFSVDTAQRPNAETRVEVALPGRCVERVVEDA